MEKYIEQNIAIEQVGDLVATIGVCTSTDECFGMKSMKNRALDILRNIPVADVVEVRHAKWEDCSNGWMCSACSHDSTYDTPYCPNCGAKMDGGVNNATSGR